MDVFRVRLNCIDHYQATPTRFDPQLRNDVRPSQVAKGTKVPVVRVFGSTETGQKVCAHIHGAFPYLYVEYQGGLEPDEVGAYIYRLHLSIDHALAVSYRRDQYGTKAEYVARITLVKGVPFYGFHVGYRFFLKIYMYSPVVMTRLADLLQQGVIMKRKFQPYEAHLQYLLQFMIDYNLYGCDYLDVSKTSFRAPVPEQDKGSNSSHLWHSLSVPPENITNDEALPRVSHCSIEVDLCVHNILNRHVVKERPLHHDFIERLSPIPQDLKLVHSMAGLWRDETKRRRRMMPRMQQGTSPFPQEALVSMSANPRDSQPQGWLHEQEYREQIEELIANEETSFEGGEPSFESFARKLPLEDTINTALQSVEDLHPSSLGPLLGLPSDTDQKMPGSIVVDENKASQAHSDGDDVFPSDSDEEGLRELDVVLQGRLGDLQGSGTSSSMSSSKASSKDSHGDPLLRVLGICRSGIKTGAFPVMEIFPGLLDAADEKGLVSRTPKHRLQSFSNRALLKRTSSASSLHPPSSKRPKVDIHASTAANASTSCAEQPQVQITRGSSTTTPSKHPASQGRQSPIKSNPSNGHNSTLNFPIVKDQNDPNTKFRLSQRSNLSSSQVSEDAGFQKSVTFDTNVASVEPPKVMPSMAAPPSSLTLEHFCSQSQSSKLEQAFADYSDRPTLILSALPPSASEVSDFSAFDLPNVVYQDAFYSREKDVPTRTREYAGREFRLAGKTLPFLPAFDPTGTSPALHGYKSNAAPDKVAIAQRFERQRKKCSWRSWEIAQPPPTWEEVEDWWQQKQAQTTEDINVVRVPPATQRRFLSQIDGPTPKNKHGFKYSQKPKMTSVEHEAQYMSTMSIEIHVNTRGKFVPNPEEDELQCIFWALKSDETILSSQDPSQSIQSGILVLCADGGLTRKIQTATRAEVVDESSELDLMVRLVEIVRTHDPDVLTGYEVHGSSWGYLIERARLKYDYNLCDEFSRMKTQSHGRFGKENDRWGFNTTSTIRVTGRHMVNIWRAMRGELNLLQYTMENVVWHLLHRRIPHYSWKILTTWYQSGKPRDLNNLLRYYRNRTRLDIEILEANELIPRTSEQARLLGVDFFSVFSRGSQYKVESIMFRIAKPENFILVSPSRKQVGGQNALECLPLVMEPQSAFYNSPLLVLDFQSLYPSIMIAYNYCYSTFLGRITNWRGMNKMGFTEYKRQQGLLVLLQDYINIAPNGMMYVKAEIRKSLLAKMLTEILETRVMVKSGMKQDKDDKTLQQLLNNRQLALKLLANVTYGYTSASFSGRMPCSEIADSIVQTARETLERAIAYIHTVERWGAEVVYGDTDSLFIYLKGRTKDEAFDIGNEIAKAITEMNPQPVKLKFEKVYHPCVLLAKKRYVGYKYESKNQVKPDFDAKGIETVRRDGTPAEQKIEEKVLRLLFETADLSQIKAYFQSQCDKIMRGTVSVQDFCFAKEVKLGTYSDKGPPPAGALISTKRMLEDARAEPQYGERVPYVVITGAPGARLIDRSVAPEELLANPHWRLDAEYYISKNLIPPLERIFNLVGANVRQWYDEMPKVQRVYHAAHGLGTKKRTLEAYMKSTHCILCNAKFKQQGGHVLCTRCRKKVPASLTKLQTKTAAEERKFREVEALCRSCSGLGPLEEVHCDSKDCPVFWTRVKQQNKMRGERNKNEPAIRSLLDGVKMSALQW
ncbi:DNA polymerase zeta catalytic subunit [Paramyrothecium foliicola]|nr:DNA polymerase zeta catalytic subunit [Paramyrothecium foliicola]